MEAFLLPQALRAYYLSHDFRSLSVRVPLFIPNRQSRRLPTSPVSASSVLASVITARHTLLNRRTRWVHRDGTPSREIRRSTAGLRNETTVYWDGQVWICTRLGRRQRLVRMGDASVYFQSPFMMLSLSFTQLLRILARIAKDFPCLDPTQSQVASPG